MTYLLLVCQDISSATAIEGVAKLNDIRVRVISTIDAAKDWLSRQSFDILLVDINLDPIRSLELVELGWKYSPTLSAGLFSMDQPAPDSWNATLLGAKVFFGPDTVAKLSEYFRSFPKDIDISKQKHSAILLVEDLDSPREIIRAYIQSMGYETVNAVSKASEALASLATNPKSYFCVVSDIHMPGVDGIRLIHEIRSDPALRHIPVIMLTADPSPENVVACVKAGASGFLAKPPKKKELLKELEKARRMILFNQSPRLCAVEDASLLEEAVKRLKR